jgi:lysophospholipase L1-like esterase
VVKNQVYKVLLPVIGTAVALFFVECILQFFVPLQFHEWMAWLPDGHITGRGEPLTYFNTKYNTRVFINEFGFRGPSPKLQSANDTFRILVLGGSAAFSYNAPGEENTWAKILERRLSELTSKKIEVVNLSLPGFDSRTQLINYLVLGQKLRPNAVLLYETWNDLKSFRQAEVEPLFGYSRPIATHNKPWWQEMARYSQIALRVRNLLLANAQLKRENFFTSLERTGNRANTPVSSVVIDEYIRTKDYLCSVLAQDGVLPILVSQGNLAHKQSVSNYSIRINIDNDLVGMTLPILVETLEDIRNRERSLCARSGCMFVDAYQNMEPSLDLFVDHVHLNPLGEQRLGEFLAQALFEKLMLKYQDWKIRTSQRHKE